MLKGADPKTFTVLNNCFAKDNVHVWTTGGKIKDVDAKTFQVSDEGIRKPITSKNIEYKDGSLKKAHLKIPYGYAKDKNRVYYENFQGKPKVVKKAEPKTFTSLNNGYFGYDDQFVFFEQYVIQKANPKTWAIIDFDKDRFYSKDDRFVFHGNKIVKGADVNTFELYKTKGIGGYVQYFGKDKNQYYHNHETITLKEIELQINETF
jgi:hypothetical protein